MDRFPNEHSGARPRRRGSHFLPGAILLALLALSACGKKNEPEPTPASALGPGVVPAEPRISIPDLPISPLDKSPIVGRWEVVDFLLTPVAAIDETTAINWLGLLAIYSKDIVGFEAEPCDKPSFREHREEYADYFEDFETDPAALDIRAPDVDVISVDCYGEAWSGPGSEVIRVQGDSLVVVFDGVFLTMEPYLVN